MITPAISPADLAEAHAEALEINRQVTWMMTTYAFSYNYAGRANRAAYDALVYAGLLED